MKIEFTETSIENDFPLYLPFSPEREDHYTRAIASGLWTLDECCTFIKRYFQKVAHPSRSFIDVGANVGLYTLAVGSLGVPVVAIEALPDNFALLFAGIRKNGFGNIRPVFAAASNKIDVVRMEGNHAWARISSDGIPIPSIPIDDLLEVIGIPLPALIKIDVEGHELEAIQGAIETISNTRDIDLVIEIFPGHESTLKLLEDMGFHCYMIKQGGLIPTQSTDFIESQVTDFYCTRRLLMSASFADTPILTRDRALTVALLTLEATAQAVDHRFLIAERLQKAPPHILEMPEVKGLLDALQEDPDERVRAAVNAWR